MSPATEAVMDMISPSEVQTIAETAKQDALLFLEDNKVLVTDLASCQRAVTLRQRIGERKTEVMGKLLAPKSWAFKLHRWFCDLENAAVAPYDQLDAFERVQIKDWNDAEEVKRQAKERELADLRRKDEEARAAAEAAAYESAGEHGMAEAVMAEAIAAPQPVVVVPSVAKQVEGLKFTRRWRWRFVNNNEARAMQLIPREFLCIDTVKLNKYATAMRESGKVPGVEFYSEDLPVR